MPNPWTDFLSTLMKDGATFSSDATPPEAAREIRSAAMRDWAELWDRSLRSPEFLQGMQQSLAGAVEFRKRINDLMGQAQHEFQVADRQNMDQLMRALRRMEDRISDGVELLNGRIGELHRRLDDLERRSTSTNGDPKAASPSGGEGTSDRPRRQSKKRKKHSKKK
jgi:hypothetical protein